MHTINLSKETPRGRVCEQRGGKLNKTLYNFSNAPDEGSSVDHII